MKTTYTITVEVDDNEAEQYAGAVNPGHATVARYNALLYAWVRSVMVNLPIIKDANGKVTVREVF